MDRFSIALQADGYIRKDPRSKREVKFFFSKKRKINRFRVLLEELESDYNFSYREYKREFKSPNKKDGVSFSVLIPDEYLYLRNKNLSEVFSLDDIPSGFIEEVSYWDGNRVERQNNEVVINYSSKNKKDVEFIQSVACLEGYYGHINENIKNIRPDQENLYNEKQYKTYRISLKPETDVWARYAEKEELILKEDIDVYCFTVPHGTFVIRHNGLISITGNCLHSETGIRLYHDLISEAPELIPSIEDIYEGFDSVVENELAFVENVFQNHKVETISKEEVIDFIKYRANLKLMELKFPPKYQLSGAYKPVKHFFDTLRGKTMNDFFAQSRNGSGYTAKLSGSFEDCSFDF